MFAWFKKKNNASFDPAALQSQRQQINDVKIERARFVAEANQLLAETERAFGSFDRGLEKLKYDAQKADQEIADQLVQIDRNFQ